MSIVFGLGSGRCGTKSLQSLINIQPASVCFHEINPSCMSWSGADHAVLSLLSDFSDSIFSGQRRLTVDFESPNRNKPLERYLSLEHINVVGDIASYYLPYVEKIMEYSEDAVFPCIVRNKDEVVESFEKKMKVNNFAKKLFLKFKGKKCYRNHWSINKNYVRDRKWDRLRPNIGYDIGLREAISRYYDEYYEEVSRLSSIYKTVKVFSIDTFNSESGREDILRFCGVENPVLHEKIHENSGDS